MLPLTCATTFPETERGDRKRSIVDGGLERATGRLPLASQPVVESPAVSPGLMIIIVFVVPSMTGSEDGRRTERVDDRFRRWYYPCELMTGSEDKRCAYRVILLTVVEREPIAGSEDTTCLQSESADRRVII